MNSSTARAVAAAITELGTVAILGYIVGFGRPEASFSCAAILATLVTARAQSRARKGIGIGSIPPPASGDNGGSTAAPPHEPMPKSTRTGFTGSPGAGDLRFVSLLGMLVMVAACAASPLPPTRFDAAVIAEIQACKVQATSRAGYGECRARVLRAYNLDDAGAPVLHSAPSNASSPDGAP